MVSTSVCCLRSSWQRGVDGVGRCNLPSRPLFCCPFNRAASQHLSRVPTLDVICSPWSENEKEKKKPTSQLKLFRLPRDHLGRVSSVVTVAAKLLCDQGLQAGVQGCRGYPIADLLSSNNIGPMTTGPVTSSCRCCCRVFNNPHPVCFHP